MNHPPRPHRARVRLTAISRVGAPAAPRPYCRAASVNFPSFANTSAAPWCFPSALRRLASFSRQPASSRRRTLSSRLSVMCSRSSTVASAATRSAWVSEGRASCRFTCCTPRRAVRRVSSASLPGALGSSDLAAARKGSVLKRDRAESTRRLDSRRAIAASYLRMAA